MNRARALNGKGVTPTPVVHRAAKAQRKINGRVCLDISRVTSPEVREYLLHKYQGSTERALEDILKPVDGVCAACGVACGHADVDYLPTRMRGVEAILKVAGVMAPDVNLTLFGQLGVSDQSELRAMVDRARELNALSTMPEPDQLRLLEPALVDLYRRNPEAWAASPFRSWSTAEEVSG